ncbi:hypothetical protein BCR36DRAFT_408591 [Piromyces finnis]|uniref:CCHC-type domain-containing protein n=1 Tax=Piromyces finnis TaxID=1754191 RepID=A0A1Y1VMD6_9FUNG|nr:hypothetical protein BCR36DRAFT_408591 [Piromyces finnis]|eukprot:ORX59054.1 hypothetical protein BCR36DRAFT_408591 [Piromyces finnis]
MVDATKVKRDLPYLCDYGKDIDSWMEDFISVMEIHDIQEPSRIFVWLKVAVEADIKNVLKSLCTSHNNVKRYPTYKEVQSAIEDYLEIKPGDKCSVLKTLKIKQNETIKSFNYKYLTLYHRLERDFMKIISVDDYLNSIKKRVYPHSQVILAECETLSEAFKVAEKAEKAERRTIESTETNNISMVYQNTKNTRNVLLDHPLYRGLVDDDNVNINHSNFNNSYSNYVQEKPIGRSYPGIPRNYENVYFNNSNFRSIRCYYCKQMGHKASECPNKRERNNFNNFNNFNQFNNQRNSYNRYGNLYNNNDNNNYNNNSYLNGFNTNTNNNNQKDNRNINENNYMDYHHKNNYNNMNNNYYMYTNNDYKKGNFNPNGNYNYNESNNINSYNNYNNTIGYNGYNNNGFNSYNKNNTMNNNTFNNVSNVNKNNMRNNINDNNKLGKNYVNNYNINYDKNNKLNDMILIGNYNENFFV